MGQDNSTGACCCKLRASEERVHRSLASELGWAPPRITLPDEGFIPLDIMNGYHTLNVDFYSQPATGTSDSNGKRQFVGHALKYYYSFCKKSTTVAVTTSCYDVWQDSSRRNFAGKVIPAVPGYLDSGIRVFFFDDNLNLHHGGSEDSFGICNLRDLTNNQFIDFSVHQNGFERSVHFNHTIVHHSSSYCNVLVQANMLDATVNNDYFSSIIGCYAKPGEKLLIFVDDHGTLSWDDNLTGKCQDAMLLSNMFSAAEVRPKSPCDFTWGSCPPVKIDRQRNLKELLQEIYGSRKPDGFWCVETCRRFLEELSAIADLGWQQDSKHVLFAVENFFYKYETYLKEITTHAFQGIARSWLECCAELLKVGDHSIMLNTFGICTKQLLSPVVSDLREVVFITVNHDMWSPQDAQEWGSQFLSDQTEDTP